MTDKQALTEARKRWGKNANLSKIKRQDGKQWHSVGVVIMGLMFEVKGAGLTWGEAFARADENKRKDDEHHRKYLEERTKREVGA